VLSDPDKRRKYDKFGEEGLKEQPQHGGGVFDMFGNMFGGGHHAGERKGPDALLKIHATLEDLYNGKEYQVSYTRRDLCPHCRGSGADNFEDIQECNACGGRGVQIKRVQVAPGFVQQVQQQCSSCGGKGRIITKTCHICGGRKLVNSADYLVLFVEKGSPEHHEIRFPGSADEYEDANPGDVIFKIKTVPHKRFRRDNKNLHMKHIITLQEALLGFTYEFKHLDGHKVEIRRTEVTSPGQVIKIEKEGMPEYEFSSEYGDLFVEFEVKLPESLTEEQKLKMKGFFRAK